MNDLTLYTTAEEKKRNLTRRFILTGSVGLFLLVFGLTAGGYARLQANALNEMGRRVATEIQQLASQLSAKADSRSSAEDADSTGLATNKSLFTMVGMRSTRITGVIESAVFDRQQKLVWESTKGARVSSQEVSKFRDLILESGPPYRVFGPNLLRPAVWLEVLLNNYEATPVLVKFSLQDGTPAIARVTVDHRAALGRVRSVSALLAIVLLISTSLLFVLLYFNFKRGMRTIEEQEERLNHQITRLSNLLTVNKSMQKSMKTASARAVELNEQFLRRVGADLHDGPAQMIGFAVMRLNKVSQQEAAKQLSHEFHAVREALDESLEEIRGISSGLVLPELEQMTLEECLRKVVTLHGTKADTEVAQFYQDLPEDIPLPIKICAYRFLQEGLNNAHRHGQAKNCRISAHVRNHVLHLSLKDNGVGFRKSTLSTEGGHLGLHGLKDRIESLGGRFSINSELGVGTALKMLVNLSDDE